MVNAKHLQQIDFDQRVVFQNARDRQDVMIAWSALLSAGGLAVFAAALQVARPTKFWIDEKSLIAMIVGCYFTLAITVALLPIHFVCLRRKSMRLAIPTIYGTTAMCIVCSKLFLPPDTIWQIVGTIGSPLLVVTCMAIACRVFLPNSPVLIAPQVCPECAYDLRGATSPGCPECGWERAQSSELQP